MRHHTALAGVGLLLFVGCGGATAAEQDPPAPPPVMVAEPPSAGQSSLTGAPAASISGRQLDVFFDAVEATDGCFFFSGPPTQDVEIRQVLGRRATTADDDGALTVDFGDGVVFRGTAQSAVVTRVASYDYQGKWTITETISLEDFGDGDWTGRYLYEECEVDANRSCPGSCRITARVEMR